MSGVLPTFKHSPVTREVLEAVKGGQLVEARATGDGKRVGVAAAGSLKVLGVAGNDAYPVGTANTGTTGGGYPFVDISIPDQYVAVERNAYYKLTYAGAVAFGESVKAAANGQVTKWVSGTDVADAKIGKCEEPGGVAAAGVGLTYVNP